MSDADAAWSALKLKPAPPDAASSSKADAEWRALKAKPAPVESPIVEDQTPSTGRAIAEGAVQGGTYGFGDELQGLLGAALRRSPGLGYPSSEDMGEENIFSPTGYGDTFMNDYRKERDAARRDTEAAKSAHPTAFNTSQIATAIAAPGPKAGKTVKGFMKAGAKGGAAFGFGSSDADLTKGDVGRAVFDTVMGGGVGGAAGLVGGVLAKPLQSLSRKATEAGQAAYQRGVDQANKPIDAAINSASSGLGGRVAAGRSTLSNLAEDAVNADLPEDLSRRASELLSDDAAKALNERVARSTQGQFFQRLPAIEKAQTALDAALERGSPEARAAATEALMSKSPMWKALGKTLLRVGLPAAGFTTDKLLGGSGAIGGGLGVLTGAVAGRPLTLLNNAAKTPAFQRSAAQLGERVAGELTPGAMQGVIGEQAGNQQSTLRDRLAAALSRLKPSEPPGAATQEGTQTSVGDALQRYLKLLEEEK